MLPLSSLQECLQLLMINPKVSRDTNSNLLQRKNMAIQEWKEKYDKVMAMTSKINKQNDTLRRQVEKQCQLIEETLSKLKQKSSEFMTCCFQALTEEKKNSQVVCVSELAVYLKKEKQLLKYVTESKESQKSSHVDLHQLLAKVQLQRTLRRIQKQQLEEEIKFLEANVLVKGNFIYNPSSSLLISPAEEKENLSRMQNMVFELERVIKLSIPCAAVVNNEHKLSLLANQQARITECQKILEEEYVKLIKFTQFVQEKRNLSDQFSYGHSFLEQEEPQNEEESHFELIVNESELDNILEIDTIEPLAINFDHPFTEIEKNILTLRNKVKKMENAL